MKICHKELRETYRALRLIKKKPLTQDIDKVDTCIKGTDELIRIFFTSIRTAQKNTVREERETYGGEPSET